MIEESKISVKGLVNALYAADGSEARYEVFSLFPKATCRGSRYGKDADSCSSDDTGSPLPLTSLQRRREFGTYPKRAFLTLPMLNGCGLT